MLLNEIICRKKEEVRKSKSTLPLSSFKSQLKKSVRDFRLAINEPNLGLIAEVKKMSPSSSYKNISEKFDFEKTVSVYEKNNHANAVSVITDKEFFGGDKTLIKKAGKITKKPILRKDFIIDEYQVYESRYIGADAILLIARILSKRQIEKCMSIAKSYNMECLIEAHDNNDLKKIPKDAKIIGINNRDLDTLKINVKTTGALAEKIKKMFPDAIIVSESGIEKRDDIIQIEKYADAVLIGTAIIKSKNANEKINELFRPKIKICGITNIYDARIASSLGADFLGFIFHKKSPRCISEKDAKRIVETIRKDNKKRKENKHLKFAGVFANEKISEIKKIKKNCSLDIIQLHGDESQEYCDEFNDDELIKAFRIKNTIPIRKINSYKTKHALFDAYAKDRYGKQRYGGTGKRFDWQKLKKPGLKKRIFLAGGVNIDNIKEALEMKPYGIDISSGVEKSPGKKDGKKLVNIFDKIKKFQ